MSTTNIEDIEEHTSSLNVPLILFFALSYIIFWVGGYFIYPIMNGVLIMVGDNVLLWILTYAVLLIPACGPFISAIIIIRITEGKNELKLFFKQFTKFKVKYYWYVLVILIPFISYILPKLILILAGNSIESVWFNNITWDINVYLLVDLGIAGLVEEPGWRGYAVPRLNRKYSPIITSLVIGVIWAFWHFTFYLSGDRSMATFPEFLFLVIALSFNYTWIYVNTKSLPLVILFHGFHNVCSGLFSDFPGTFYIAIAYSLIVIIVLKLYGSDLKIKK